MEPSTTLTGQKRKKGKGPPSLVVSTSRPSSASTATGGGSLTLICPRTGAIQSYCRVQGGDLQSTSNGGLVGVNTLSFFPSTSSDSPAADPYTSLAIAYGSTTGAKRSKGANASYGMMFTVRRSAAAPILHWKCHLPEPDLSAGLLVSPVSRHVVGGGSSGTLYVWNPLQGGRLVRTVSSAHYRAITCMQWSTAEVQSNVPASTSSPWDCHLVTGGADGMVHVFSHLDLVEQSSSSNSPSTSVKPIRTWTKHHLAVTSLKALNGGRIASASEDGQVVLMEVSSGETMATFQMPDPIRSLATDCEHRLFAGSAKGVVHIVDLDEYALHKTVQMGATIMHQPRRQHDSLEARVFGNHSVNQDSAASPSFQKELRGHDSAITSLVVFEDDQDGRSTEYLVSGDEAGLIRVWDSGRSCCVRVLHPWSQTAYATPSNASAVGKNRDRADDSVQHHPVTSIQLVREQIDVFGDGSLDGDLSLLGKLPENKRMKGSNGIASMVSPLQKYTSVQESLGVPVPYLQPRRGTSLFTNLNTFSFEKALASLEVKRAPQTEQHPPGGAVETGNSDTFENNQQQQDEIERLKKELDEAKATIQRWEVVNNKLMGKLQEK